MGRIAGVSAAETRERLLRAAADVFAERGYDGARVAHIAAAAGVSNGALYAHFASKADLLADALRTHGRHLLADMFAAEPDRPVVDLLLAVGRGLRRRRDARGYLIVEALVAARRDEDVARPMRAYVAERADWLAGLMRLAQADGELDPALSPDALAHFCLLLAMGSALLTPDLHVVGEADWATLLTRVAAALAMTGTGTGTGTDTDTDTEGNAVVKVHIDAERCQGHGRCYDLTPGLFADDEEGYGRVTGGGVVPPGQEAQARLTAANCPERAIELLEETSHDR